MAGVLDLLDALLLMVLRVGHVKAYMTQLKICFGFPVQLATVLD